MAKIPLSPHLALSALALHFNPGSAASIMPPSESDMPVQLSVGSAPDSQQDRLAWLGALPPVLDPQEPERMLKAVVASVMRDIEEAPELANFVCRSPGEVGPVPMMPALQAYLDAWPAGRAVPSLVNGLYEAAAAGNWLARSWVFVHLAEQLPRRDLGTAYRFAQLATWLQANRIGTIHASLGEWLNLHEEHRKPDEPNKLDYHAAMRSSYAAQYRVGRKMSASPLPFLAKAGQSMVACALSVMPAYSRLAAGGDQ